MAKQNGQLVLTAVHSQAVFLGRAAIEPAQAAANESPAKIADRLLSSLLDETRARQIQSPGALEEFFRANHEKVLAYAKAILLSEADAQDAVGRTYEELLRGKTSTRHFFRALQSNARDRLRQRQTELERTESTEKAFNPQRLPGEDQMAGGASEAFTMEPPSPWADDQDPLDQLIQREEQAQMADMVQKAFQDPRWRFCKRKLWAHPLLPHVPK